MNQSQLYEKKNTVLDREQNAVDFFLVEKTN